MYMCIYVYIYIIYLFYVCKFMTVVEWLQGTDRLDNLWSYKFIPIFMTLYFKSDYILINILFTLWGRS